MALAQFDGIRTITKVTLQKPDGTPITFRPTKSELDRGIELAIINSTSNLGEEVIADLYTKSQKPTLTVTAPSRTKDLVGILFGREILQNQTLNIPFDDEFEVTTGSIAGVTSGKFGYGMAADQAGSVASAIVANGVRTQLTQQNYGTFNSATSLSFAQGANASILFSDDIVSAKYTVNYSFPYTTSTVDEVGSVALDEFSGTLTFVTVNRAVGAIVIPRIKVDLAKAGKISFDTPDVVLPFYIPYDGSICDPFSVRWSNKIVSCV
jgi:hypothetical protein